MALDAREDVVAEVAVEEMDVRAAHAHDLGAQHDLARPGLSGLRHVEELHRALATGDRRQHGRDPTRPWTFVGCTPPHRRPIVRVSDSEGIQRLRPSNERPLPKPARSSDDRSPLTRAFVFHARRVHRPASRPPPGRRGHRRGRDAARAARQPAIASSTSRSLSAATSASARGGSARCRRPARAPASSSSSTTREPSSPPPCGRSSPSRAPTWSWPRPRIDGHPRHEAVGRAARDAVEAGAARTRRPGSGSGACGPTCRARPSTTASARC